VTKRGSHGAGRKLGSYYSYAPRLDGGSLIRGVPLIVFGCVLLSVVYAICLLENPFLFLNPFLTAALGAALVFLGRRVLGRSRTRGVGTVVGVVTGLLALYVSWLTFEYSRGVREGEGLGFLTLMRPDLLWAQMESTWQDGWFSVQGRKITGLFASLHSVVEAALIVGIPTLSLRSEVDSLDPYCEKCGKLADFRDRMIGVPADPSLFPRSDAESVARLARGDWSDLKVAQPLRDPVRQPALLIGLGGCGSCQGPAILFVEIHGMDRDNCLHLRTVLLAEIDVQSTRELVGIATERELILASPDFSSAALRHGLCGGRMRSGD